MFRMNYSRGFFRLWAVLTAMWLVFVCFIAWINISDGTFGRYQYALEAKEGVANPFEGPARPTEEIFAKPSEAKSPPNFSRLDYQYWQGFDDAVRAGTMKRVDLPDATSLYVLTAFGQSEAELVCRWFWEGRWRRRLEALSRQGTLLGWAIIPPLLLLMAWFVGRWIVAGFRRT